MIKQMPNQGGWNNSPCPCEHLSGDVKLIILAMWDSTPQVRGRIVMLRKDKVAKKIFSKTLTRCRGGQTAAHHTWDAVFHAAFIHAIHANSDALMH